MATHTLGGHSALTRVIAEAARIQEDRIMADHEPRDDNRAPRQRSGGKATSGGGKPYAKRDGDRKPYGDKKPYERRDGDRPYAKRDGDRKPYGDKKPYERRDGDRPYANRDGEKKSYGDRKPYGDKKPYERRDGDRPYVKRDGGKKPYGDKKPYERRDGDRPYASRDGDRKPYGEKKPYERRDGDRPYVKRDGDRKPYGDKKPYERRDGGRPYAKRDGDKKPYERRDNDRPYERKARPTRGGADRPDRAMREGELRPVRARHDDPVIPEEVTARDLPPAARNELKTLSKENADQVARHLAMASQLIDEDPELAHQHALSASRRAGRIAVVRETLAITAYATGDYALALRELRTYRRISGNDDQIALMVDSERGVGRPDRALEVGRSVDRMTLETSERVELAIAMSGARLDLGEPERALQELDIPELDPDRAFEWSPGLFAARAAVLEELGRADEAAQWQQRAVVAAEALDAASGIGDLETIIVEEILEEDDEDDDILDDESDESEGDEPAGVEPSVADEVAEILVEAGIDEPEPADDGAKD
jgi:hypothetical protein